MPKTFTITRPTQIVVDAVRLVLPVRYGDEDMPSDYPFRTGDVWDVTVDMETGRIRNWPGGHALDLYMKVVDEGCYYLLDCVGTQIGAIEENYVPHGVVPGEYGDYVDLQIDESGLITNWSDSEGNLEAFFPPSE